MRSIQEAPQSNRGGPGRVRRRCVVADPGCGDREFATSSDVADGRSSLPQDGRSGGLCARGLDESRSGERSHSDQRPTPSDTPRHLDLLLSAFLEVVRAPSSLSFTEGQPAPDRVPKCTSVAVYELNATTQALRNRTRRTRIHVERYTGPHGAVFALRTRMKDVPPRQLAFVRLPSAFLACRCFNLLVLRSHRPRKC